MVSYSQNSEDIFILNYFGNYVGNLLDIGANDGVTFSNSRLLIENGWDGVLFEPGIACGDLFKLYADYPNIKIYNRGVGEKEEVIDFWESGAHVIDGTDRGLVSTTDFEETKRWPLVEFIKRTIKMMPISAIMEQVQFDFISIDAEGYDWKILKQIDLEAVGCTCLCIEWNGSKNLLKLFTGYCKNYKLAVKNAENLIFVK